MGKNSDGLPERDRKQAAKRMQARREEDARTNDKDGFSVTGDPDRPSHPDGWQAGGRDEHG